MTFLPFLASNRQRGSNQSQRLDQHTALPTIDSLSIEESDLQEEETLEISIHVDEMPLHENEISLAVEREIHATSNDETQPSTLPTNPSHTPPNEDLGEVGNDVSSSSPQSENSSILQDQRILNYVNEHQHPPSRISTPILLVACMFLFRLFLEGLANGDARMLLAVLLSIWFLRWIQLQRIEEERYDEELAGVFGEVLEGGDRTLLSSSADVQLLGFRGQLALAMMESRRYMSETGGFGRPDGAENVITGVSEETKAGWRKLNFDSVETASERKDNGDMQLKRTDSGCCICLGEYEMGEPVCELPCGHVFHEKCISNWCENNQRCPLCNINLEEIHKEQDTSKGVSCVQPSNDSLV